MSRRITRQQIGRLSAIVIFSLFVSFYFPPVVFGDRATLTDPSIITLVFVFLAGFLISQAITRNREMDKAVSVELSRLRRLVHLTRQLSAPVSWKKKFSRSVVEYLDAVATNDLSEYEASHAALRVFTRALYAYQPKIVRDQILFKELLEVSREAAYQRQRVGQLIASFAASYVWYVLILVVAINIIVLLGSREPGFTSQMFIAAGIAGLLLVLDMLYDQDVLTRAKKRWYQARYAGSAKDLRDQYA